MPTPKPGEKRGEYIQRAVMQIRQEEPGKDMKEVLGKAYGLWNSHTKKRHKRKIKGRI